MPRLSPASYVFLGFLLGAILLATIPTGQTKPPPVTGHSSWSEDQLTILCEERALSVCDCPIDTFEEPEIDNESTLEDFDFFVSQNEDKAKLDEATGCFNQCSVQAVTDCATKCLEGKISIK